MKEGYTVRMGGDTKHYKFIGLTENMKQFLKKSMTFQKYDEDKKYFKVEENRYKWPVNDIVYINKQNIFHNVLQDLEI